MAYNIAATSPAGPVISRRVQPQRAVKQARDYRRRGYTEISIIDPDTGQIFTADSLAAVVASSTPAVMPERGGPAN